MIHRTLTVVALAGLLFVFAPAEAARATFPGENGRIAFDSTGNGNADIFTMKPNGKDVRQLTDSPAVDAAPDWSPDGTKIVFISRRDGNTEIYVMNADGSNQQRLTNHPALDSRPAWSPDGTKIAFVSTRDGGFHPITGLAIRHVFVMNADGSNVVRLTNPEQDLDNAPRWSPDGTKIAFLRVQAVGRMAVFTINSDGSGEQKLTPDSLNGAEPDWSPDGMLIAFQNNTCPLPECSVDSDILVMKSDRTNIRHLTHNQENQAGVSSLQPRWAPEGNKIVFHQVGTDPDLFDFDVLTMTANGTAIKNLTPNPNVSEGNPVWGPAVEN